MNYFVGLTCFADAVEKYTADGMRFGLADAGDTLDDANFQEQNANSAILRLHSQIHWAEEILASVDKCRTGHADAFADKVFAAAINKAIEETDHFYSRCVMQHSRKRGTVSCPLQFCMKIQWLYQFHKILCHLRFVFYHHIQL